MATRGQKPKPNHLKVIAGTDQPCRRLPDGPEFPVVDGPIDPPDWMNVDGLIEWRRLVPMLQANKVLTEGDLTALQHLCQLHGDLVDGYKRRVSPTAAMLTQLRAYYAEFGLTPSSRMRVSRSSDGKTSNKFEGNGKRPA